MPPALDLTEAESPDGLCRLAHDIYPCRCTRQPLVVVTTPLWQGLEAVTQGQSGRPPAFTFNGVYTVKRPVSPCTILRLAACSQSLEGILSAHLWKKSVDPALQWPIVRTHHTRWPFPQQQLLSGSQLRTRMNIPEPSALTALEAGVQVQGAGRCPLGSLPRPYTAFPIVAAHGPRSLLRRTPVGLDEGAANGLILS